MGRPEWSMTPGERQQASIERQKQASKLAKVRARMEQAAIERERKAKAHLN